MAKGLLASIVLVGAVGFGFTSTHNHDHCQFLPENDQWIPVEQLQTTMGGITEADFNNAIDRIETLYKAEIEGLGGELVINRLWDNGTVNASAQRMGSQFVINMYGGLARHETITADGFALVLCHEMGHHRAGAPKVKNWFMKWASNEGQSDYYATKVCLRRLFAGDDNEKIVTAMEVPELVQRTCASQFTERTEQLICMRGSMAGHSVSSLFLSFGRGGPSIDFGTPDPSEVRKTYNAHPKAQCRLDTYFAGAVCDATGELSDTDFKQGTCWDSTVSKAGLRPRCWFQPQPTWWERMRDRWNKKQPAEPTDSIDQANDQYEDSINDGIIH